MARFAGPPVLTRLLGPWVAEVSAATLRADLLAGLLGALLVLPQGVAFATLAGLPPQHGLYAAIVPCAVAALFGSSRHVVSGPTNATSLALFAMLIPLAAAGSPRYIELALGLTVLVGLMQLAVGLFRLGSLANFISPAALLGFTAGAAVLIAVHASKDLLGLEMGQEHGTAAVVRQWAALTPERLHLGALLVGGVSLAAALVLRLWWPRWPGMLVGLAAGSALGVVINQAILPGPWAPVPTIGTIPAAWPPLHLPQVEWHALGELLGLALALSIVALAQSISIAKAVARRSGQRIDANREFIGQGLSNLVGGLSSSYVSCGSLNRSLPNFEAGARTPLAAVFSSVLLLLLVLVGARWLSQIPKAAIAGLLVLVAWGLLDLPRWRYLLRHGRVDLGVALATFAATVTMPMQTAILLGTLASLATYLYRTSKPALRRMGFDSTAADRQLVVVDGHPGALPDCRRLLMLRMEGSVYFGAVAHVAERLDALRSAPGAAPHLLVMARSMNFIDLAGAELWQAELQARRRMGGDLYFHRPRPEVLALWERIGFLDSLGRDHVFQTKSAAIAAILARFGADPCAGCGRHLFHECRSTGRAPGPPQAACQITFLPETSQRS